MGIVLSDFIEVTIAFLNHTLGSPFWWVPFTKSEILDKGVWGWSCMSIPEHSLLSGEPRDCSIDIQTEKVVHTGVMFLPELAWVREMFRNWYKQYGPD